jgi:hypothetical protein
LDAWKKDLQRRPAREAYEIVIKDDTVEAYQAYLALYPLQPGGSRVREVLDRRLVMVAWYTAVTVNMPSSYRTFLASYAKTDLGGTAQRLLDRALNRSLVADTNAAGTCPCSQPAKTQPQEKRANRSTKHKSADDEPPRRAVSSSPPPNSTPVSVDVPIGIGIGILGGMGGGMGGGGMRGGGMGTSSGGVSRQPPTGGSTPMGGSSRGHSY